MGMAIYSDEEWYRDGRVFRDGYRNAFLMTPFPILLNEYRYHAAWHSCFRREAISLCLPGNDAARSIAPAAES